MLIPIGDMAPTYITDPVRLFSESTSVKGRMLDYHNNKTLVYLHPKYNYFIFLFVAKHTDRYCKERFLLVHNMCNVPFQKYPSVILCKST